jgi:Baseplate J-like protein
MPYIELDLMTDPDALVEVGVEHLEQVIPGFEARPGSVETVLLEANAQIGAEIVEQMTQIDPVIFGYLGEQLLGIAPYAATPAVGTATVTFAATTPAVMLAAGSLIGVPSPSGDPIAFATDEDVVAPDGGGQLTVGVTALEAGSAGNDCFGEAEPIDVVEGVESISVSTTTGGTDDEESDVYLTRLVESMRILAPRPILPADFSVMAQQVPDVGRATTLDLYQPATGQGGYGTPRGASPQTNVPRCATVVITAADGEPPPNSLLQSVQQQLDARREVNFLVYTIPPSYTVIEVQATLVAYPGYDLAAVQANAEAQLAQWLSPSGWGTAPFGGTTTDPSAWVKDDKVRLYEAIDYLNRADGVHYVSTVALRVQGGTFASNDITLSGPVALPRSGTHAITVQPAP